MSQRKISQGDREVCRNYATHRSFRPMESLCAPAVSISTTLRSWYSQVSHYRVVYFVISSILGGKKAPLKIMIPYLERYMKTRESLAEKPVIKISLVEKGFNFKTIFAPRLLYLNIWYKMHHQRKASKGLRSGFWMLILAAYTHRSTLFHWIDVFSPTDDFDF
jgi:hypothetical protein